MRPSVASEFGDAEILAFPEASSEESHTLRNFSSGFIEGVAGVVEESGVDSESQETVGFGCFGLDGELLDFNVGTVTTRPLLAG